MRVRSGLALAALVAACSCLMPASAYPLPEVSHIDTSSPYRVHRAGTLLDRMVATRQSRPAESVDPLAALSLQGTPEEMNLSREKLDRITAKLERLSARQVIPGASFVVVRWVRPSDCLPTPIRPSASPSAHLRHTPSRS